MINAIVKLKTGTIITIEGEKKDVQEILSTWQKKEHQRTENGRASKIRKKKSATDFITELKNSGFFDKPKSLTEIRDKLAEHGHIYPITSLPGVVLRLIRKRELGRVKEEGLWKYVKR